MLRTLALIPLFAATAFAYTGSVTSSGMPVYRTDASNIQFQVNRGVQAGATGTAGGVAIAAGSDPRTALEGAIAAWNGVSGSAVHFAALQDTDLGSRTGDGFNVIALANSAETRSIVGSYLAVTVWACRGSGAIVDSDIIINPGLSSAGQQVSFSTNHALGTYDLQSVVTHELGHALGAAHSGIVSATMFHSLNKFSTWTTVAEATAQATPEDDDAAFLRATYPAAGSVYGSLVGTVRFDSGTPVRGAHVVALDPSSGVMVGGVASLTGGTYTLAGLPEGRYLIYAQPLNGPVQPSDLGIPGTGDADTSFRTTFFGGNGAPVLYYVGTGAATCDLTVDSQPSEMGITQIGTGSAGGSDWATAGTKAIEAGRSWDILIWGKNVSADRVRLLGPGLTVRPGSARMQSSATVNGMVPLRVTVDVATLDGRAPVALAVAEGTDAAVSSGALLILPASK